MNDEVRIEWDYLSPRNERWIEWYENGKRHLKRVSDELYQSILARCTVNMVKTVVETDDDLDFLN